MKIRSILIAVVAATTLSSCASMFSGSTYTANIHAVKPNSEIYVNGKLKGTDNAKVTVRRKTEPTIEVKSEGETTELILYKSIKWGSQIANLLNWIYFIPTGTIIDAATGAIWQPEHKHIEEVEKVNNKVFNITL
jgi:hypothetical protein